MCSVRLIVQIIAHEDVMFPLIMKMFLFLCFDAAASVRGTRYSTQCGNQIEGKLNVSLHPKICGDAPAHSDGRIQLGLCNFLNDKC